MTEQKVEKPDIQCWTVRRKAEVAVDIINQGKTTVAEIGRSGVLTGSRVDL